MKRIILLLMLLLLVPLSSCDKDKDKFYVKGEFFSETYEADDKVCIDYTMGLYRHAFSFSSSDEGLFYIHSATGFNYEIYKDDVLISKVTTDEDWHLSETNAKTPVYSPIIQNAQTLVLTEPGTYKLHVSFDLKYAYTEEIYHLEATSIIEVTNSYNVRKIS